MTAVLVGSATPALTADTTNPFTTETRSVQPNNVGVFTGKFADGMPVYQLPPVTVIANRKGELAKIGREEQLARIKQVRAKAAARPPA
ncbi:MAG TPA: hypothetical protein VGL25_12935 [Casimicrobiaceae bacterium]